MQCLVGKSFEFPIHYKKFFKIQLQIGIVIVCPKSLNSIYGTHNPLGVKHFQKAVCCAYPHLKTLQDGVCWYEVELTP